MQPLTTLELYLNWIVAVGMPLIIVANLNQRLRENARNAYLWRDHAGFMRASLVVIGLLALWSITRLANYYGLISADTVEAIMPVLGVPFLIAAVVEIWLLIRLLRSWRRAA
jgi:hypothetical protein